MFSKGHLVAEGPIELLGRGTPTGGKFQIEVKASPITGELTEAIKNIKGVVNVESSDDTLLISCENDLRPVIAKTVVNNDSLLSEMKIEEYDLEEIYLKYFRES